MVTWLSWLECGASSTRVTGSIPTWAPIRIFTTTLSLSLEPDPSPAVSRVLANTLFAVCESSWNRGDRKPCPDSWPYRDCGIIGVASSHYVLGILFYGEIDKWSRYFFRTTLYPKIRVIKRKDPQKWTYDGLSSRKKNNTDQLTVKSMS